MTNNSFMQLPITELKIITTINGITQFALYTYKNYPEALNDLRDAINDEPVKWQNSTTIKTASAIIESPDLETLMNML
jgi:hypothetical protein